jgi:uncharacterized membrane protein
MRGRSGGALIALTAAATAIAAYLTWSKLTGTPPACAVAHGCETVEQSQYASLFGIPVAFFGLIGSAIALAGSVRWRLEKDRRGLLLVYVVGLISLPVLAYLTYLEVAVIHAVCLWCATYAITSIVAWGISAAVLLRTRSAGDAS